MTISSYNSLALLVLRIGASAMMLTHGIPKIEKLFNSPIEFPDPLGIGSLFSLVLALLGEVIAPILIIIGLKSRFASIIALITMLVAAFMVHAGDSFGQKEKALLYALCFLVIFLAGPGKFSIDKN
ncbi:MAG: DoxX family protein [Flavobacteriaceae bacterium]|nr:DoxX family protein [Flavobacteriaceae bacterium]